MPSPRPPTPRTYNGDFADPPKALAPLCLLPHWVVWRWQRTKADTRGEIKWTKPPFRADNPSRLAANNSPATWAPRHSAVAAVLRGEANGIGFALTNTKYAAIDLDHCRNPQTGEADGWAKAIIDRAIALGAYVEVTVSGTGFRIIGTTAVTEELHTNFTVTGYNGAKIELYRHAVRYITVSGLEVGQCTELPNIDKLIDDIAAHHRDKPHVDAASDAGAGNGVDDIDELLRHGAAEGQRSEAFARVIWSLAGQGLSREEIEEELRRFPDGIAAKYGERLSREIERCFSKWQREQPPHSKDTSHDWQEPDFSILDDRRGELPEFPVDILTPGWRHWLERAAHGAGVRSDHVAIPLLGVASSLVGTARRVRASKSWSEPLTLWNCIVGESGDRKTPGLRVIIRALDFIEDNNAAEIQARRLRHETAAQRAKEVQKKWKEERQEALDAKPPKELPPMPLDAIDPDNFIEPRLYATDPTIERLASLLQARPRGMMLIRDELSGLFANMSRYSSGNDRPFWLEAFNGGRHVVERVSGSIVVDHLLVGVIGTFQPDKLARAFAGDEDGMYARFVYAWPLPPIYKPLTNEVSEIEPELVNALTALIRLPSEDEAEIFSPQFISLSQEALVEFEEFRKWIDTNKHRFDGRERHWFVKGEITVLRLAGTLCYMAWAMALHAPSSNGIGAITERLEPKAVDKKFVADAVHLWRVYFWPHARGALRQIGLSDRHRNARRVLKWLKASPEIREIGIKDIRRDALAHSLDAENTKTLIESLVASGWLKPKPVEQTGGRPIRRWLVNPILYGGAGSAGSAESHAP